MNQFPVDQLEGFMFNYPMQQYFQEQQQQLQQQQQQLHNAQQTPPSHHSNTSPPKRKNNKDPQKRTWVCGCGRSYGSNAALYTHIKNKHDGFQPQNTIKPPQSVQAGRRGRPLQNIKKDGQFKKGDQFVEIDNLEMRKQIIEYDRDSNQILVAFLEFGEQDVQKNPFEEIVTDKKGNDFLNSGMTQKQIEEIEENIKQQLNIDKDKQAITEPMYKVLNRFTQIWKDKIYSFELIKVVLYSQYMEGKGSSVLLDYINQSNDQNSTSNGNNENGNSDDENQQKNKVQKDEDTGFGNLIYMKYCSQILSKFEERLRELNRRIYYVLNHKDDDQSMILDHDSELNQSGQIEDEDAIEKNSQQSFQQQQQQQQSFKQSKDLLQDQVSNSSANLNKPKSNSNIEQLSSENNCQVKKKIKQTYIIQSAVNKNNNNNEQTQQQKKQEQGQLLKNNNNNNNNNNENSSSGPSNDSNNKLEQKEQKSVEGQEIVEEEEEQEEEKGVNNDNQETSLHVNNNINGSDSKSAKTSTEIFNTNNNNNSNNNNQ